MDKAWDQVRQFHLCFSHPVSSKAKTLNSVRANARYDWMKEELDEFMEAENIYDQADAMIDLMYFALGTLVEMGLKPQELFDIVHQANMDKLWEDGKPRFREDGKTLKPEGWVDPFPKMKAAIDKLAEPK